MARKPAAGYNLKFLSPVSLTEALLHFANAIPMRFSKPLPNGWGLTLNNEIYTDNEGFVSKHSRTA